MPTTENGSLVRDVPLSASRNRRQEVKPLPPPPAISKLEDNLLVEVVIRIGEPRSACRCKLVCKQWNALISDPYFVRRFDCHHGSGELDSDTPLLPKDAFWSFIPVPVRQRPFVKISDSYKDLVLCRAGALMDGELFRSYLICNPSTKQWITLPLAPKRDIGNGVVAKLVCEPLSSNYSNKNTNNLDRVGCHDDKAFVYASQYRFRVVLLYHDRDELSTILDVFCSESGEWTKDALVLNGHCLRHECDVGWINGELFCLYGKDYDINHDDGKRTSKHLLAVFNPFRLDIPPTLIGLPSAALWNKLWWKISISRGALHVIAFEDMPYNDRSKSLSNVWRLKEDRKSWSKQCEGLLNTSWYKGLQSLTCFDYQLHPENPNIIFFEVRYVRDLGTVILSCNLKSGEVEHFSTAPHFTIRWTVFQPRVSCWPTPIPRYQELRGRYDGSHSWLAQRIDKEATTPSPPQ